MDSNKGRYSVEMMAKALSISPSSYYNYRHGVATGKVSPKEKWHKLIQKHYFLSEGRNGAPRIACDIKSESFLISSSTVSVYMREMGIKSKLARKFKVSTTDSNHGYNICENLLNREFSVECSSKVWVSDITYIHTKDGFIYLTTVIDLYDRKVIGWSISNSMKTSDTVIRAFEMAIKRRDPKIGMIFHSDRGVQYACAEFVNLLKEYNIVQSMSRKGNCWDNAVAESFFKTLKCELIYGNSPLSPKQMELMIFEYIETWYNRKRRHSAIGNLTIEEFWNNVKPFNNYKNVA